jgi:acyl carrier protein
MAQSKDEVLAGLAGLVNDETGVPVESVVFGKSFADDLDIDSISMMTIVVNAEEEFGVKIPDDKVNELKTVDDAVNYIISAQS